MRRKFALILTLTAWLFATGSHWDLVQTFAWGKMLATYSQTMPFTTALKKTFSADGMCGVCKAVESAKQQETSPVPGGKADLKVLLVFEPASSVFIFMSDQEAWVHPTLTPRSTERASPPLPPPRAVV